MGQFKCTHDFGIIEEHPRNDSKTGLKKAIYDLKEPGYQESYKPTTRPIAVADRKTLQYFIDDVLNNLTYLAEMAVPKADSSTRYVFVYRVMIVFYRLRGIGAAAFILQEHIARKYVFNTTHPEYNICWFGFLVKAIFQS
jgi:hypothetical protein